MIAFAPPKEPHPQKKQSKLERVAHAGGAIDGTPYTNSLEALDLNRDRYDFFEVDLNFTSDGHLVCIHDWNAFSAPPTLSEFEERGKNSKYKNCTLESLVFWMNQNPRKTIITDVKQDNLKALQLIAQAHPTLQHRIIPQIYHPAEYFPARQLGYNQVIFTLYVFGGSNQEVLNAARRYDFFAITMPPERALALAKPLKKLGVPSYVHTINSQKEYEQYKELGISEIYTDSLWIR
ncbi:hypothetical protein EBT16_15380 [bacterium]|nr:hypothetical protein [bacterium]